MYNNIVVVYDCVFLVCDHCAVCQDRLGCTECDDGYIQHEDLTCHRK